ncbi:hypothetical protein [Dawidia soli]|uniref:Uncharacterized protein n=1 Tax=Dawidia soli TaxID=2782352 RepID=A0AAP2DE58_9BACT|nr:hypothetical protein [Dawidia soli]MBT1689115.1 hypothetical protein [Dawidia soli]
MRSFVPFCLLILVACAPIAFVDLHDANRFQESPTILRSGDRYFIRFRYADLEEGPPLTFMAIRTKVQHDTLLFYIPSMASDGNMAGRLQIEEIKDKKQIDLIDQNKFFWKEVNNDLVPLTVGTPTEEDIALIDAGVSEVY